MFIHVVGCVDKRGGGAGGRVLIAILCPTAPLPSTPPPFPDVEIRAPENAPNCFFFLFLIGFPAAGISELICFNFRPDLFARAREGKGVEVVVDFFSFFFFNSSSQYFESKMNCLLWKERKGVKRKFYFVVKRKGGGWFRNERWKISLFSLSLSLVWEKELEVRGVLCVMCVWGGGG